ncbi:GreA/GreB family elongation factor [Photobacterium swingsii]|uniref:GreA/GreB family elongation factor n=1 Tax=Photobacterium swingsii TaxID=680026 RepID=UPI00352F9E10
MDKQLLHTRILQQLQIVHQGAVEAAQRAYDTATNDENVAENQYDTLALEASYLAHGQSQRVAECLADIQAFTALDLHNEQASEQVVLGSLVQLIDEDDNTRWVFFGPSAGGMKIMMRCDESQQESEVVIITPTSPLGEELLNRQVDDEVEIMIAGKKITYDIAVIE